MTATLTSIAATPDQREKHHLSINLIVCPAHWKFSYASQTLETSSCNTAKIPVKWHNGRCNEKLFQTEQNISFTKLGEKQCQTCEECKNTKHSHDLLPADMSNSQTPNCTESRKWQTYSNKAKDARNLYAEKKRSDNVSAHSVASTKADNDAAKNARHYITSLTKTEQKSDHAHDRNKKILNQTCTYCLPVYLLCVFIKSSLCNSN